MIRCLIDKLMTGYVFFGYLLTWDAMILTMANCVEDVKRLQFLCSYRDFLPLVNKNLLAPKRLK